ncbi:MAG: Type IV fimbrial assembly, ATPase PilB, partial [uncultured Gemmatimonadetes bacterium]
GAAGRLHRRPAEAGHRRGDADAAHGRAAEDAEGRHHAGRGDQGNRRL